MRGLLDRVPCSKRAKYVNKEASGDEKASGDAEAWRMRMLRVISKLQPSGDEEAPDDEEVAVAEAGDEENEDDDVGPEYS